MPNKRASQRAHHVLYKTTCLITGKWYIGIHSTDDLDDGYLGSGQILWWSIKKHGRENHKMDILEHLPDRKSLALREEEYLKDHVRKNPLCMNIAPGGEGYYDRPPTSEETRKKLSEASKNYVRTPEWYAKVVATRQANGSYQKSAEEREKIRNALTGKVLSEEHRRKISEGGKGQKRSEETRQNISIALKGKNKVKKPFTEAHKEAIRQARLGKKHSDAARINMKLAKQRRSSK